MKKLSTLFIVFISSLIILSGCSYKIPLYEVNEKNTLFLKNGNNKLKVSLTQPSFKDVGSIPCRAAGNVEILGNKTFSEYIAQALEDELKYSGHFDSNSEINLNVKVIRIDFS